MRRRALLAEFESYQSGRGKIKQFRSEAVRAGEWNFSPGTPFGSGPVSQSRLFLATCVIVVASAAAAPHLSQTARQDSHKDTRPDWFVEDPQYRPDEQREKVIQPAAILAGSISVALEAILLF